LKVGAPARRESGEGHRSGAPEKIFGRVPALFWL